MQIQLDLVPRQLAIAYAAGANVWMWAKPAVGKTAIAEMFARIMAQRVPGFQSWHLYVPTLSPNDIQAAMPNTKTGLLEFYNNASLPNAHMDPDLCGVLHLGELANGDPTVVKLLQKYVNNEDMNGVLLKPKGVMILADSNRLEHKSGSIQQFRAFLTRFTHLDVYTDARKDMDFAAAANWHPTVQAFMREHPDLIDNYDAVFEATQVNAATTAKLAEEGKRGIWSHKRGLERLSDMEKAADSMNAKLHDSLIYGTLGTGAGAQYITQREVMSRLQSLEAILANPTKAPIPSSPSETYAQCVLIAAKVQPDEVKGIVKYALRLSLEFQIVLVKRMNARGTEIQTAKGWVDLISNPDVHNAISGKE